MSAPGQLSYSTIDRCILKKFPSEKTVILSYFYKYKNDILKLYSQDFMITTSWGTRINPGGKSSFHRHKNCAFSGVLYMDKKYKGGIEFNSWGSVPSEMTFNPPTEWNVYNSTTWLLECEENTIIFFPSYLHHQVPKNLLDVDRYSFAFNFHPVGEYGDGDSSIFLQDTEKPVTRT